LHASLLRFECYGSFATLHSFATRRSSDLKGEALFLRAHYHFEAYRMWGHIPYYFETDTTPVTLGGFRSSTEYAPTCGTLRSDNRSEEHTSELQSRFDLVCRLLLEKKKTIT